MTEGASSFSIKKWRVSAEEAGMGLLAFLRKKDKDTASAKSLKRAIDGKRCAVNGKTEIFSSHSLKKDDIVVLDCRPKCPIKRALRIIYEDQDLLIVDKPSGLVCENRFFGPLLKQRAELIHRLDKETSGVVMLGKNKEILKRMIALFREKAIHKQYLAVVDGCLSGSQGKINNTLRKGASTLSGQVIYEATKGRGLPAITYWKCLKKSKMASFIICEPITGRTHQLRIHLNGIGHPILGDIQYGKHFRCFLRPLRHLLHAFRLSFVHPKTHQKIDVVSELPLDFQETLHKLGLTIDLSTL